MSDAAHRKMIRARSELVLDHPFFATLALRLDMRADETCRTAWSDGRVLAYNPGYIESLPLSKVKGLQCHEVLHLACRHHTRRDGRDARLWNMACDYAINPVLLDAGLELPQGYLDDPEHHGRNAESIYATITARMDEAKGGAEGGEEEGTEAAGGSAGQAREGQQRDDGQESSAATESDGEGDGPDGDGAGAATDGDGDDDAKRGDDPGMTGEVRDAPPDSGGSAEGGRDAQEDAWQDALAQALHKSRESGTLPGSLERLVGGLVSPPLCWSEILRRFVEDAARNDFSWVRPNRRHLHDGLYLPGLENRELAEVAVAVDVSGSITQAELDRFASELSALLEEFDAQLTVFTCDARLTRRERLCRWDLPLNFEARGGGGTDFRPPFEGLEEEGLCPACLIYFTDLECSRYPEEPGYPVLWVAPGASSAPPPFGEVVTMEVYA